MLLNILAEIGSRCIIKEDGQKIYDKINDRLINGEEVTLDFEDVSQFASPFFNFAIGQLLKDMDANKVRQLLRIVNLSDLGELIISRVIENASKYHENKDYKQIVDDIIEQQSQENN